MNCRVLGEGNKGKFMPKGKYIFIRALYKSISKDFAPNITTEVMVKFWKEVNWKSFMYFEGGSRFPNSKVSESLRFP